MISLASAGAGDLTRISTAHWRWHVTECTCSPRRKPTRPGPAPGLYRPEPAFPPGGWREVQQAESLQYRDFLIVGLILKGRDLFSDNWIYTHDPAVKMGRIQNYKSWSPEMVPDPQFCCYGLEYFCFEGDRLWTTPDAELIELASRELQQIGLGQADDVLDG